MERRGKEIGRGREGRSKGKVERAAQRKTRDRGINRQRKRAREREGVRERETVRERGG